MNSFAQTQKQVKEQAARQAIYEATLKVLAQPQGESLKMQDIAAAAGIATGTLYNYFKNKVELLTFVNLRLHTVILDKIEEITCSGLNPADKLTTVVREIFAFFKAHHIVFDLAEKFGTKTKIPKATQRDNLRQAQDCLKKIIDEGIARRQFTAVDSTLTAKHFFSAMIGAIEIQSWLQDYEMSQKVDELSDFFRSYLTIYRS